MHYAGPNTTDRPRRAYILVLSAPPTNRHAPADRPWQSDEKEALARLKSLAR
jgi:hypothetical protein